MQDQEEEEDLEEDNKEEEEVGRGRFNDFQHHDREESQSQNHRGELRGRGKQ